MFQVVRKSWDKSRVIATFDTKKEAEAERRAWERQTAIDFKEGRIMYDVPDFVVIRAPARDNPSDAYRNWLRDVARRVGPDVVRSRERDLASLYVAGESAAEAARVVVRRGNPATPEYPPWQLRYSNEDFDRIQALAFKLTDEDRRAGRPAPEYGYSGRRFKEAEEIVRRARRDNPQPWARVFG